MKLSSHAVLAQNIFVKSIACFFVAFFSFLQCQRIVQISHQKKIDQQSENITYPSTGGCYWYLDFHHNLLIFFIFLFFPFLAREWKICKKGGATWL